jgi:hypothetical protein
MSGGGEAARRWKELIVRALHTGRGLERKGRRGGGGSGWCSPFIGARGKPGRGGNDQLNGLNAIDGGEGL